ncbi:hypothetical protein [Metabacillus endolithicus]|uniref:Uncharacterized protein n=1 Tax=Metabacillus endolithicus TaxID=1535204 RepID=A0ABW5BYY8_9BACI|nr:hypothetical protein [Metabacillus endolithicus]
MNLTQKELKEILIESYLKGEEVQNMEVIEMIEKIKEYFLSREK